MDLAANDNDPVIDAAKYGHLDIVKLLCDMPLERGVDVSAWDSAALRWAATHGHAAVVRYLGQLPLERGVDPFALDESALRMASQFGKKDVVRALCEIYMDRATNAAGLSHTLVRAAQHGVPDLVRDLCANPEVDPALANSLGLYYAAAAGHEDIVKVLCNLPPERGVDPAAHEYGAFRSTPSPAIRVVLCDTLVRRLESVTDADPAAALATVAEYGTANHVAALLDVPKVRQLGVCAVDGFPVVRIAAERGDTASVLLLASAAASPTAGCEVLEAAGEVEERKIEREEME